MLILVADSNRVSHGDREEPQPTSQCVRQNDYGSRKGWWHGGSDQPGNKNNPDTWAVV